MPKQLHSGSQPQGGALFHKADLMVRAVQLHYLDGLGLKAVAERLGYKNPSSVSRLLLEARKTGVIQFVIDSSAAITAPRDEGLEASLMDAFELDRAIVVRVPESGSEYGLAQDDQLHVAIANAAGDELRVRLHSGTHLGLGGGRAVYHAVNRFRIRPPRLRDITITPLTGRLWAHYWDMNGRPLLRPMDADDAAFCLALAFENRPGTRFRQIVVPAFAESPNAAAARMKEHCQFLPDGRWKGNNPPDLAIIGAGALEPSGGHRMSDLLRDTPPETQTYLQAGMKELKSILQDIQNLKWSFSPVGDVTNRLFPVLPMPNQLPSLTRHHIHSYHVLSQRINLLNQRVVAVRWSHLRQIRHVLIVAGGPHKLNALWTLLVAPKPFVKEVCTDAGTARKLLKAADSWAPMLQKNRWLRTLWEGLFQD